jgi:glycosyltransferase involved in cell wall biosynthesis
MKLAFVIQRYGLEVNGGAEHSCRLSAEHLSKYHDIEVLTSCAKDYMTWKNEYKEGNTRINNVLVRRFKVDKERNIEKFDGLTRKLLKNPDSELDENKWMEEQGPYLPKMLDYISSHKNDYDFFIFFTYRYYHSFAGLPIVQEKSILVPTAENDFTLDLRITKKLFALPQYYIYHTEEEKQIIDSKFKNENIPAEVIGVGIDVPEKINPDDFKKKYNIENFVIYVGRIDESKGCKELFNYFINYRKREKYSDIKLVLLGKQVMKVPEHPDIKHLGFVSEQDKFNGITAAKLMIMPSRYESFSMVIMESWLCNIAVLVNGNCEVLKGHCIKSNGGLYFKDYEEFRECLNLLLANSHLRARMGENGRSYVEMNYGWDIVEPKYTNLLEKLVQEPYLYKKRTG